MPIEAEPPVVEAPDHACVPRDHLPRAGRNGTVSPFQGQRRDQAEHVFSSEGPVGQREQSEQGAPGDARLESGDRSAVEGNRGGGQMVV